MSEHTGSQDKQGYRSGTLSLSGAVGMGTGVMIGAGVFALTGQIVELAGPWFVYAFVAAAVIAGLSSHAYIMVCKANPSAGGIAMILEQAYGPGVITAGCSLLMYFSMVINESLVARTFGVYTLRFFGIGSDSWLVPALGVGLIVVVFILNLLGNRLIDMVSKVAAIIKILGLAVFSIIGLVVAGTSETSTATGSEAPVPPSALGFMAGVALAILAYKGFTTITNSGAELKRPERNVGLAIMISLGVCTVLYLLMAFAVGQNLSIAEIIAARDSALAEAARPAVGQWGEWLTVVLAIVATVSGLLASMFAVSRMLAMLVDMELVPFATVTDRGRTQKHTLVYTAAFALLITVFLDLSRIASVGIILYLIMDLAIQWGVYRKLRERVNARAPLLVATMALDAAALAAFCWFKAGSDPAVLIVAAVGLASIFSIEAIFLRHTGDPGESTSAG